MPELSLRQFPFVTKERSLDAHLPPVSISSVMKQDRTQRDVDWHDGPEVEHADVPLHRLRSSQGTYSPGAAAELAKIPREAWEAENSDQHGAHLPQAVRLSSGNYRLDDGHHRAIAAGLRGDTHLRVAVVGSEVPRRRS